MLVTIVFTERKTIVVIQLADFAVTNNKVMSSTFFPHKNISSRWKNKKTKMSKY
jgi:hypothetical protein